MRSTFIYYFACVCSVCLSLFGQCPFVCICAANGISVAIPAACGRAVNKHILPFSLM